MKLIIEKSIPIECSALGPDLDKYLEQKLGEYVGQCTHEHGYILSIGKFKIVDTEISRATSEPIITVRTEVETLKPEVGKELKGKVAMCVSGHGIYAYNNGKIKILVSERSMKDFRFENGSYKSADKVIMTGDEIDIVVTAIKYDKNNFQCIGNML
jgi:DNA-directed RNA polymerase subunit E'/Rpb7